MADSVAVLVDGDNITARYAATILEIARRRGSPAIVRVYADASRSNGWDDAAGYRVIHAGPGKNAADVLLAIDAMELLLSRDIREFIIASSDGDFTHIAQRLREHGAGVTGLGEMKTPIGLRACYISFIELDEVEVPVASSAAASDLDRRIRSMIASHSKNGQGMRISDLSPRMHAQHGTRISTHPEKTWRAYLLARPHLYEVGARGPDAMVRFKPDGFSINL